MECTKFGFLFAAMTLLLVAMATSTALCARNEVVPFLFNTDDVNNIWNPFANIFFAQNPAENCIPNGRLCIVFKPEECCSGFCAPQSDIGICALGL